MFERKTIGGEYCTAAQSKFIHPVERNLSTTQGCDTHTLDDAFRPLPDNTSARLRLLSFPALSAYKQVKKAAQTLLRRCAASPKMTTQPACANACDGYMSPLVPNSPELTMPINR